MSREVAEKILINNLSINEQFLIEEINTLPDRLIDSMIEYSNKVNKLEGVNCHIKLICIDDGGLPNLTQDNVYKMIVESKRHYNIIDDNGNDVLISKKYLTKC